MPPFSKAFPFLQRFHFPPHGEPLNPRNVAGDVVLVHELFRADLKHAIRLQTVDVSNAGAGVDIVQTPLLEPPSGMISIPLIISIAQSGAAGSVNARFTTTVTGTPIDLPTGVWPALDWVDLLVGPGPANAGSWTMVPFRLPIPRGNQVTVTWRAVAVGKTVQSRSFCAHVPIECVDWTQFGTSAYMRTEAV